VPAAGLVVPPIADKIFTVTSLCAFTVQTLGLTTIARSSVKKVKTAIFRIFEDVFKCFVTLEEIGIANKTEILGSIFSYVTSTRNHKGGLNFYALLVTRKRP
jgi:hypothetical protein